MKKIILPIALIALVLLAYFVYENNMATIDKWLTNSATENIIDLVTVFLSLIGFIISFKAIIIIR